MKYEFKKFDIQLWSVCKLVFVKCWFLWLFFTAITFLVYYFIGLIYAILWSVCLILGGVLGLVYVAQDRLLYHPEDLLHSRVVIDSPSIFNLPFDVFYIRSQDGTLLHVLFIKQLEDCIKHAPTILFLHGNAGNTGHRIHNAAGLYKNLKCNILMLEYRGYGLSEGSPNENGLCMDARAAIDFLISRTDIDHTKIIVFGRSLGGAVAIDLVSRPEYASKIWCLILENTFTSIPDMAKSLLNWTVLKYLPTFCYKNKYLSLKKIPSVRVPTLFLSGLSDALVPPSMMSELHAKSGAERKLLLCLAQGGHNDTWKCSSYYANIKSWIDATPPNTNIIPEQTVIHLRNISEV